MVCRYKWTIFRGRRGGQGAAAGGGDKKLY